MSTKKFKDVFRFAPKSKIKAGEGLDNGRYSFFTSSPTLSKYINKEQYLDEALIFGTGGSASIHYTDEPFSTSTDCFVAISYNKSFNTKFVYYYLYGNLHILERGFKGAGLKHISKKYIQNIDIPLFEIETQNKIVAILDKASTLVQKRKHTIDLLGKLLKSQFLEMFGDFETFDRVQFEKVLLKPLRNGISPSSNGSVEFDVLTLSAITTGGFDNTKVKSGVFKQLPDDNKLVNSSDFLVCRGNGNIDLVGVGEFAEDMDHTVFPDTIIAASIDTTKIGKHFLTYLWKTEYIRTQIKKISRTTNGTHKINQAGLEKIEMILPPMSLQEHFERFANALSRTFGKNSTVSTSQKYLEDLLRSLSQQAFTGQLKFDVTVELDALLEEIDLQKPANDLISIITNEEYLLNLVNRLNKQQFENQSLYDKAKHAAFQLLKEEDRIMQEYNEITQSLKLVVK